MLSANNLLKPQDGKPVTVPSQDMVLGSYYLTIDRDTEPGAGKVFRNVGRGSAWRTTRALSAFTRRSRCVCPQDNRRRDRVTAIVDATPGRLIFNERIPQDLGFVDRSDPSQEV